MREFEEAIKRELKSRVTDGDVQIVTLKKNNGEHIEAVLIKSAGDCCVPCIHLHQLYEEHIVQEDSVPEIYNYSEDIKRKIHMKVVQYEANKKYLEEDDIPHIIFPNANLVGIFYMFVELRAEKNDERMSGTVIINNRIIRQQWQVDWTAEDLYNMAIQNTKRQDDIFVMGLSEYLARKIAFLGKTGKEELYIVSNKSTSFGASVLFVEDTVKILREKLKVDKALVIPSSINELLVTEYNTDIITHWRNVLRQINSTGVRADDILLNELLVLDLNTGEVTLCTEEDKEDEDEDTNI